ncbi:MULTISPECIES: NAD(P)H-dependent glycerol-3-phosphate dehydrogenase [Methylosinus]|uniref:Glycerol-3-phosphate dehydrogenase [NAD(P)+] n=1 Tax=Methylosinus trichosporium (strain ATCC 35070 / NCIMB 11131 / UNIQEM 75 / OB3b) TaxID=595536 RepID=A0A2D2D0C1_METT3|nr:MULTISPECIES: NAD(P)H-dependent glycerol-3-phosphate dehydrogenase [Methylosinus]ATQ68451.1 NAD(P)-dependent glycerol-3-phosphate dehydrogenase [Methylosinus trichosporium OB3b]OBS51314.1 glycerol-3-phosphate dehydrogenase [Methylosinus sp. 3S-1]
MTQARIAVLGAGAWGTALANVAATGRSGVVLWGHRPEHVAALARERENRAALPGLPLAAGVAPSADLASVAAASVLLGVVPAQAMREVVRRLAPHVSPGAVFIICAKGIERGTRRFMSEVVAEELPQAQIAVLSGPSFAADVCRGLPTAVTLAAEDEELARRLCELLSTRSFRLYRSTDLRGVELGGAAKNVLAIAAGMAEGRALGASARAALIARGFAELMRLGKSFGVRQETLMGLSGLGDLVLTCGSAQSRNFALGAALASGEAPLAATHGKLAEGAFTAAALVEMARERGVEIPIAEAVDAILTGRIDVDQAIEALLMRPLKAEA